MANTATIEYMDGTGKFLIVKGQITLSGNYATAGEDLTSTFDEVPSATKALALFCTLGGNATPVTTTWFLQYDRVNNKLQIFGQQPTAAGAGILALDEKANGTANPTDPIDFVGYFLKGQ